MSNTLVRVDRMCFAMLQHHCRRWPCLIAQIILRTLSNALSLTFWKNRSDTVDLSCVTMRSAAETLCLVGSRLTREVLGLPERSSRMSGAPDGEWITGVSQLHQIGPLR